MLYQGNFTNRAISNRVRSIPLKTVETETILEEQLLLKHLSQGDDTAFWTIWGRYQKYLYSRCLTWMGGNHTDADEALSRATLKAWRELPKYALTITNSKAWLTRLTHNLCVDIHREHKRGAMGMESIEDMSEAVHEAGTASPNSPESALLRREMELYIRRAVEELPPKLREPFILRFYREMPYSDIAQQLALSNENVRKRIQQAREVLQKRLKQYLSGLDDSPPLSGFEKNCALEEPQSNESAASNSRTAMTAQRTLQPINYRVTATCLVSLLPPLYSSPSLLGWR